MKDVILGHPAILCDHEKSCNNLRQQFYKMITGDITSDAENNNWIVTKSQCYRDVLRQDTRDFVIILIAANTDQPRLWSIDM